MDVGRLLRALPLLLFAVLDWSCANELTKDLDGKACNDSHQCSDGYQCEESSMLCLRVASAPASCAEDSVSCDGKCARLASDPENCGGCGATCSAPAHGVAVCLNGACNFACPDLAACGDVCVDFQRDPENCGACGQACSDPLDGHARCVSGKCQITCASDRDRCGDR